MMADEIRAAVSAHTGRILLLGHDRADADSVLSCMLMRRFLHVSGTEAAVAMPGGIDRDTPALLRALEIEMPKEAQTVLQTGASDGLILLDHNRTEHPGKVLLAIDHHPLAQSTGDYPKWIEPAVSACALLIWRLLDGIGAADREATYLAVCAAYLDTFAFGSTKTAPADVEWCAAMCKKYGFDAARIAHVGLCLDDPDAPAAHLAAGGFKRYAVDGATIASTYVKTDSPERLPLDAILSCLRQRREAEGYSLWIFAVTDPVHRTTDLYRIDRTGTLREHYDHIVSRTKEIQPRMSRMLAHARGEETTAETKTGVSAGATAENSD